MFSLWFWFSGYFILGKAETAVKTRHVFHPSESARAEFLQRFPKADPKRGFAPEATDHRQAQMQTKGYIKAAASRPLTAAQLKARVAYSGSIAKPNELEPPVTRLMFTFCPSRSAWPIEPR